LRSGCNSGRVAHSGSPMRVMDRDTASAATFSRESALARAASASRLLRLPQGHTDARREHHQHGHRGALDHPAALALLADLHLGGEFRALGVGRALGRGGANAGHFPRHGVGVRGPGVRLERHAPLTQCHDFGVGPARVEERERRHRVPAHRGEAHRFGRRAVVRRLAGE